MIRYRLISVLTLLLAATVQAQPPPGPTTRPVRPPPAHLSGLAAANLREARSSLKRNDVQRLLPQGRPTRVRGNIAGKTTRDAVIRTDAGPNVDVANPEAVQRLPDGMSWEFTLEPAGDKVRVKKAELSAVSKWKEVQGQLPRERFANVHAAFKRLERTVEEVTAPNSMAAVGPALDSELKRAEDEVVTTYSTMSTATSAEFDAICAAFDAVRDARLKARFGRLDNYWPVIYPRIYESSRSAVAIARRGEPQPFGSGVLIGKTAVLTCEHVANQFAADSLEVWFDFEATADGSLLPKVVYPVRRQVFVGTPLPMMDRPLDFALLELGPGVDHGLAGDKYPKAVLGMTEPARDDAIFVVGHPNSQPKTVHDNAFVLFPFSVNARGLDELKLVICSETKTSPNRTADLNQFIESYVGDAATGYKQFSKRWFNSPVIAAECDTFHGNSGSGVWSRTTNRLIGIIFAGQEDLGPSESFTAGWLKHEAVLPISVVVSQLDAFDPNWRTTFGVEVQ